jgi:hypothetical protein
LTIIDEERAMPVKLCRWGNSLGIRVPAYVAEVTGLTAGDYLSIRVIDNGDIVIRPVKAKDVPAGYTPAGSPVQTPPSAKKPGTSEW